MAWKCSGCGDVVDTAKEPPMECLNCGSEEWDEIDEEDGADADEATAD